MIKQLNMRSCSAWYRDVVCPTIYNVIDSDSGLLLKANSAFYTDSVHMHSNCRDTSGHLQLGFIFNPEGYEPKYRSRVRTLGNGVDVSVEGNARDEEPHAYQVLSENTKAITFEPHLRALGQRMCLEAIWGYTVETLSGMGYDHNWERGYGIEDDHAPLLGLSC